MDKVELIIFNIQNKLSALKKELKELNKEYNAVKNYNGKKQEDMFIKDNGGE